MREKSTTNGRKPYLKPSLTSEKMFETSALACGKCTTGPFPQYQCGAHTRTS